MFSNSISCGNRKDVMCCYISDKEKIMLLDKCGSITQWNLNMLLFEKQYQLDTIHHRYWIEKWHCVFNKNSTLLVTPPKMCRTISQVQIYFLLRCLEFISSDEVERLLLFFDDYLEIRDPYHLQHVIYNEPIPISVLCEKLLNKATSKKLNMTEAEFKILLNENLYYILDNNLWVQEIFKKQWTKYLREELKDDNKIRVLPNKFQIEEILQRFTNENDDVMNEMNDIQSYEGSLVKWEVNGNEKVIQVFLKKFDSNTWKSVNSLKLDILRYYNYEVRDYHDHKLKIYSCNLLDNEDLAIITDFGLFLWSIWQKDEKDEIRLRYYMSRKEKSNYKSLLDRIQKYEKINSLPSPDFNFIINNYEQLCSNKRYLFKELLDDYIENKLLMKLYGQELLLYCSRSKNYSIVTRLCNKIYKETENDNFLVKI
ncbi:hypothetical protein F8M41_019192 [Gigaspora margarita]|uniref:Uncharacterized protein n=1 Tax=Gigaspora margarita TaxID=4874 RepID=A0A8H4B2G1_GIGMA|nr:hypothetical protein F8M41_019192 [Gigaspora margarita]